MPERQAVEELIEPPQGQRVAWAPRWDKKAAAEQLCEAILQQQPGLSERELWRALARRWRMLSSGRWSIGSGR